MHSRYFLTRTQLAEAQRLQKEAEDKIEKAASHVANGDDQRDVVMIPKPKGEAGSKKGWEAMKLNDNKDFYDAIQVHGVE
jgi:hypothetical protein